MEATYQKWVQYKEDCMKMIESEPLPQGTETVHARCPSGRGVQNVQTRTDDVCLSSGFVL